MALFEDTFEVTAVDPDGKKFTKGAVARPSLRFAKFDSLVSARLRVCPCLRVSSVTHRVPR